MQTSGKRAPPDTLPGFPGAGDPGNGPSQRDAYALHAFVCNYTTEIAQPLQPCRRQRRCPGCRILQHRGAMQHSPAKPSFETHAILIDRPRPGRPSQRVDADSGEAIGSVWNPAATKGSSSRLPTGMTLASVLLSGIVVNDTAGGFKALRARTRSVQNDVLVHETAATPGASGSVATCNQAAWHMLVGQGRSLSVEKLLWEKIEHFRRLVIKELAAVATDPETNCEITAQRGRLARVVAASALRLLMMENRWAVHGRLGSPVPVSTCRALGPDPVIAVGVVNCGEKLRVISGARSEAEHRSEPLVGGNEGRIRRRSRSADGTIQSFAIGSRGLRANAAVKRRVPSLYRSRRSVRRLPGIVSVMLRSAAAHKHRSKSFAGLRADNLFAPRLVRLTLGRREPSRDRCELLGHHRRDPGPNCGPSANGTAPERRIRRRKFAHRLQPLDSPAAVFADRGSGSRGASGVAKGAVEPEPVRAVIDTTLPTGVTPQTRDSWARAREHGNVVSVTVLTAGVLQQRPLQPDPIGALSPHRCRWNARVD